MLAAQRGAVRDPLHDAVLVGGGREVSSQLRRRQTGDAARHVRFYGDCGLLHQIVPSVVRL